jgi:membrane protease YdiL (CAAX protease family)
VIESEPASLDPEHSEISPWSAPAVDPEFATPEKPAALPRLWGPWETIGWTLLGVGVMFGAQLAGLIIFFVFRIVTTTSPKFDDLVTNGNVIALATLISTSATVGLIALLVRIRRFPIRDYLALYWPSPRVVLASLGGLAVLLVATDLTSYLVGRPLVPTFMVDIYRFSWLPALLLAVVVLAPIGEETIFRGFLYTGIAASRAGPVVAIIVSSLAFALLHVQYDWYGIVAVAATGLFLGVVRYWSRSLLLTMLLHAVGNLVATLEVIVQESWLK